MIDLLRDLVEGGLPARVTATVVLIIAAIAGRFLGRRIASRLDWASEAQARRIYVQIRNAAFLLTIIGLIVIWADELRSVALSLVAVAVALVIATKEIISAISASMLRASTGAFQIGDRISIGSIRGDVVDHSLMQTTLLEIGDTHIRTGRVVTVPNSMLLTEPVANETRGNSYVLHAFTVPVEKSEWQLAESILLARANELAAPYMKEATETMRARAERFSIPMPVVEPLVLAKPATPTMVDLTVRLPAPAREIWKVEEEILRAWLIHQG